ncbi:hypothetical protein K4F52_007170 [Lecanicillium sp. MT-2017a]|nr:hypothetical protein K4F52_007170 [Lecanicillium sp. MT-2017a]
MARRRRVALASSSPQQDSDSESDENQVIEIRDSDDEEDDSSEAEDATDLLDDEASEESGLHSNGSPSSDEEEEVTDPFPFHRLPPELRLRIWQMFCPDLLGEPRVLDFSIQPALLSHYPEAVPKDTPMCTIYDGRCLEDQTLELRRVMAVNREARSFALDVYPHQMSLDIIVGGALIWFNQDLDVIMLDHIDSLREGAYGTNLILPQFADQVLNLAIPFNNLSDQGSNMAPIETWLDGFPSLKRLFLYAEDGNCWGKELKEKQIQWCASENINRYTVETFEREPGYGEDDRFIIAWPDLLRHGSFAKVHVPKWDKKLSDETRDHLQDNDIETWPMVLFNNVIGLERLERLLEAPSLPLDFTTNGDDESSEESSEDEDFESEPDAYESDGIDDTEHPETFSESGEEHLDDGDEGDTGRFSSPEGSPAGNRGRKRRIVDDSEDDASEEEDEAPRVKRARTTVVLDSDEEDHVQEGGSAAVVISDDSDDEPPVQKRDKKPRRVVDDEDDSEEEDEDEDEDAAPRRIALAERLHTRRRRHEVDSEGDSEEDDEDEEDYEGEEDEEEGDGLIDDMAMESDEDEDEEDDEEDEDE